MENDWRFRARDKQLPPEGDWLIWLMRSGRRFGKTWSGANWVNERAREYPGEEIALIGQTVSDVRDTMVEKRKSSIIKQAPADFVPIYEPSKRTLTWPNGAFATTFSGDVPDQLRGAGFKTAWIDELAKFQYPQEIMDQLELCMSEGDDTRIFISTTPRPIQVIKDLIKDSMCIEVTGSIYENPYLSERFLERMRDKYEGTRLGEQELHGKLLTDTPGALWTQELLDRNRITPEELPPLRSIAVGVDPSITSDPETSAATGIVVCGLGGPPIGRENGHANHYYTLADHSLIGTPNKWGNAVISAYYKWNGNMIVPEKNQGGDMVINNIGVIDPNIPIYNKAWATKSKHTRAEPIANLAEQGRDHLVGYFPDLEDELTTWVPGEKSPDRLDAKVWAVYWLMKHRSMDYWIPEG